MLIWQTVVLDLSPCWVDLCLSLVQVIDSTRQFAVVVSLAKCIEGWEEGKMNDTRADLAGANSTLLLTNELVDVAQRLAASTGAEPAVALFGAAIKTLKEQFGDEAWIPVAECWLQTLIKAEIASKSCK